MRSSSIQPLLCLCLAFLAGSAGPILPAADARATASARQETPRSVPGAEKVQVNLVLIDVVVRDRKDRPIGGLRRDDFELLVDRLPVDPADIETFEEICPAPEEAPAAPTTTAATTAAAPEPPSGGTEAARHIILYLDFSQMSLAGRRQSLSAARDYVASKVTPVDRVMILAFKRTLRLVQDFSSDPALLASRLDAMMDDTATVDSDVLEESRQMYDVALRPCDATGQSCTARRELASTYAQMEQGRARRSLHAIEGLMPALAGIRGRKALVLFSDTLRDEPGVQYLALAGATPSQAGIEIKSEILRLTREANAAGVSLYTVHATGLDDRLIEEFRSARPDNVAVSAGASSVSRSSTGSNISQTYLAAQAAQDSALSMQTVLAAETGGRSLQRTNDLGSILATARQDLSCYYLLGYRYLGVGDGARHSLLVHLKPGQDGESRRGLTIRHRPYYTDLSGAEREERLLRSALEAPELYHALPMSAEVFALAPSGGGRQVLIKATVPIDALSLTPSGASGLAGRILVTGEIAGRDGGGRPVCEFRHEVPLQIARDAATPHRVIFETGCILQPGGHEMSLAVLDPTTQEVGARRVPLSIPPAGGEGAPAYVSDVYLWARDEGALLVAAGAAKIGLPDRSSTTAFVPRSERRLARGEPATLSFLFCPAAGSAPTPGSPIHVRRALLGDGDVPVSDFDDILLTAPPEPATGCYQIVNAIPANMLGDGVYRFTIRLSGGTLGEPLVREAALAVD